MHYQVTTKKKELVNVKLKRNSIDRRLKRIKRKYSTTIFLANLDMIPKNY